MKHKISDCIQETNIQLIQQSMKVISDKVNETNQLVKEFIKEIKENYVTKIEHDVIKTQIKNQSSEIQKIDNKFWGATVGIIGLLVSVVFMAISNFINK